MIPRSTGERSRLNRPIMLGQGAGHGHSGKAKGRMNRPHMHRRLLDGERFLRQIEKLREFSLADPSLRRYIRIRLLPLERGGVSLAMVAPFVRPAHGTGLCLSRSRDPRQWPGCTLRRLPLWLSGGGGEGCCAAHEQIAAPVHTNFGRPGGGRRGPAESLRARGRATVASGHAVIQRVSISTPAGETGSWQSPPRPVRDGHPTSTAASRGLQHAPRRGSGPNKPARRKSVGSHAAGSPKSVKRGRIPEVVERPRPAEGIGHAGSSSVDLWIPGWRSVLPALVGLPEDFSLRRSGRRLTRRRSPLRSPPLAGPSSLACRAAGSGPPRAGGPAAAC